LVAIAFVAFVDCVVVVVVVVVAVVSCCYVCKYMNIDRQYKIPLKTVGTLFGFRVSAVSSSILFRF